MDYKPNIQKIKKINFIKIIVTSIIGALLSLLIGGLIGMINFDFASVHFLQYVLWILNVIISYSIAFGISKIYKSRFSFFNVIALSLTYTFSVVLVILILGFDVDYITSYLSVIAIIGAIYGLFKLYKSKKKFYK
ncbi:MAG TPA: hypothetical protein DD614_00425 [Clostridiales bacterium]|nr:hypothetical protein [Clostridiales bacterium]